MPTNKKQSVASVKDVKRGQNKETRRIATVYNHIQWSRAQSFMLVMVSDQSNLIAKVMLFIKVISESNGGMEEPSINYYT